MWAWPGGGGWGGSMLVQTSQIYGPWTFFLKDINIRQTRQKKNSARHKEGHYLMIKNQITKKTCMKLNSFKIYKLQMERMTKKKTNPLCILSVGVNILQPVIYRRHKRENR